MADPYKPQLGQQSTPLSGASAEDFGAAAARGLEEAGATIDRTIHQVRERDRDMQAADAGVELANASTEIDKLAIDGRANAGPGGEGHTEAVAKAIDERQKAALARIKDPKIRAAFGQRWAQLKDNLETREYGWQAGARVDKLAADVDTTGTTLANGMASNPNGAGLDLSLSTIETSINAMALPADLKTKLIKEQQRKIAAAYGNGIVDNNPKLLVGDEATKTPGLLDKGVLSQYLEPEDIDRLRSGAHVEIRRQDALDRAEQARAEATAREGISTLLNKVGDGYVPTDAEWKSAGALAKQYGLEGKDWDLGVAKDRADLNRESRDWTPAQWHANVNALEAKGDKRTVGENVRLKHLQEASGSAIARFNSDPFAAAAVAGDPAPAVDWTKPEDVQKRISWARAYRQSAGLTFTPYMNTDELSELRGRSKESPAGKIEVASELRNGFGVGPATEIAKQIDGNDKDLQIMVGLQPRMAQLYKNGVTALKLNPKLLGVDPTDKDAMRGVFAEFSRAIPDPDVRLAVFNAAQNMLAGRAAEVGKTELSGDELTSEIRRFIHYAGGRQGGDGTTKGGFARWYSNDGGPGYVWLPQSMNETDFGRAMQRAGKADWLRAGGGAEPYYLGADGKRTKMSDVQIGQLGRYEVETVSPGRYRLVGADGGHVVGADGQAWQFNVEKLAH